MARNLGCEDELKSILFWYMLKAIIHKQRNVGQDITIVQYFPRLVLILPVYCTMPLKI